MTTPFDPPAIPDLPSSDGPAIRAGDMAEVPEPDDDRPAGRAFDEPTGEQPLLPATGNPDTALGWSA